MVVFKLVDTGVNEKWEADSSVPNFPTRESYLAPFEGTNLRPPELEAGFEEEDIDEQDSILLAGGLKSWGNPAWEVR